MLRKLHAVVVLLCLLRLVGVGEHCPGLWHETELCVGCLSQEGPSQQTPSPCDDPVLAQEKSLPSVAPALNIVPNAEWSIACLSWTV